MATLRDGSNRLHFSAYFIFHKRNLNHFRLVRCPRVFQTAEPSWGGDPAPSCLCELKRQRKRGLPLWRKNGFLQATSCVTLPHIHRATARAFFKWTEPFSQGTSAWTKFHACSHTHHMHTIRDCSMTSQHICLPWLHIVYTSVSGNAFR